MTWVILCLFWEKIRWQSRHSLRRRKVFTKQTCHNSFTALRNLFFLKGLWVGKIIILQLYCIKFRSETSRILLWQSQNKIPTFHCLDSDFFLTLDFFPDFFRSVIITVCSTYLSDMVSHHFITFPCAGYAIQHIYESVQGNASSDYNTTIWCLQWKQRTLELNETHSHIGELVSGLILSGTVPK